MTQACNIAVAGATGRMGQCLIQTILAAKDMRLHAALARDNSPLIGQDAGAFLGYRTGISISSQVDTAIEGAHLLIDFTRPDHTLDLLAACQHHCIGMVIGTTGFDNYGKAAILRAAASIGIVSSPNFSVGINLVLRLLDMAARVLHDGYDVEIIEAHHRFKVDAPSGTALRMGEVVAQATGRHLADCAVYQREGIIGERDANTIGFATVRGGDIIGDHTVLFAAQGERLEITHKATNRSSFSHGALRAARWLISQPNGLYDMQDVLGVADSVLNKP